MADLYVADGSQVLDSMTRGMQTGLAIRQQRSREQAGGLMASGDYKGAAAALYGSGDLATGSAVAKAGVDQQQQTESDARKLAVQQKIQAGDLAGAYAAAGTDSDLIGSLDKISGHLKETSALMASGLQALKGPDGQWLPPDVARQKYLAMKPLLAQRGIDPAMLDKFDPTPENLTAMQAQVLGLDKQLEMSKGVSVGGDLVNPYSGQKIYQGTEWKSVGEGDKLVPITGGQPGLPGAPAAAGAAVPPPTGGVYDQVAQVAQQNGATPEEVSYLTRLAQVESSGNPAAQNGSSTGVFQFHPDTFASLGGHDIHSVPEQTYAALALSRHARQSLQQIGVEPTDANAYVMHQQGAAGGRALLTADPSANAVQVLTPLYGSADLARKAVVGNGGSPDMSAGQFVGMWQKRWAGAQGHGAASPQDDPPGTIYGAAKVGDAGELTPDTIHLLAGRYLLDGSIPALGMGKGALAQREKILNEASGMAKSLGVDAGDLVAGTLSTKAAGAALTKTATMRAQVDQAEQTAIKNADLMLSLAPKGGGQTGAPVLNRWIQYGRKQVAGDADVSSFDIAIGTFSDEYAKVTSGSLGNQATTDASRKEAYDRLSKYATQGQLAQGVSVMKQEMQNRAQALADVEAGLRTKIRSGGAANPTPMPPNPDQPQGGAQRPPGWSSALTRPQLATAMKFKGATAPGGSQGNPFTPVSLEEFNALPVGAHFINPADGRILQKTH